MFGIIFYWHSDLRRILTDYGFSGFPLRKDFPMSGFVEVNYSQKQKRLLYNRLVLAQEYRNFSFEHFTIFWTIQKFILGYRICSIFEISSYCHEQSTHYKNWILKFYSANLQLLFKYWDLCKIRIYSAIPYSHAF